VYRDELRNKMEQKKRRGSLGPFRGDFWGGREGVMRYRFTSLQSKPRGRRRHEWNTVGVSKSGAISRGDAISIKGVLLKTEA